VKKISAIILLAMMGWSFSANAAWVGNWLIGGSLGFANQTGNFHTNLIYVDPATALPVPLPATFVVKNHSDNGMLLEALLGYQAICRKWLVGIEFEAQWRDLDQLHPFSFRSEPPLVGWAAAERYERKRIGALSARLGYALTPYFMFYGRMGAELGKDHFQTIFNGIDATDDHWTHRFLWGAGFEIPLPRTCGATFRFEYNYASKGRTLETVERLPSIGGLIAVFDSTLQPITQSWKGSLIWNFF